MMMRSVLKVLLKRTSDSEVERCSGMSHSRKLNYQRRNIARRFASREY